MMLYIMSFLSASLFLASCSIEAKKILELLPPKKYPTLRMHHLKKGHQKTDHIIAKNLSAVRSEDSFRGRDLFIFSKTNSPLRQKKNKTLTLAIAPNQNDSCVT